MGGGRLKYFRTLLFLVIGVHFALITYFSILKILSFKTSIDLALFEQAFWSLRHTGIPTVTLAEPYDALNWFGWHFSPIFYLLLPFYALLPSPLTLQIIQCLCFSLTAIPVVCALRRLEIKDSFILLLTALLLFNPFYFNACLWDFHEISLACLFIACAYYALIASKKRFFIISLVLLALTKEHFGLSVMGFGLFWWWRYRDGKFGLITAGAGVLATFAILALFMPWLHHGEHIMLSSASGTSARYGWISTDIPKTFSTLSQLLFSSSISPISGVMYLFLLALSACFLPLLALPAMLPSVADLLANLLSLNSMPRSVLAYHSASIIPVAIIAAGFALKRIKNQKLAGSIIAFSIALQAFIYVQYPAGLGIVEYELTASAVTMDFKDVSEIKSLMGDSSLSVQPNIAFLFAGRAQIYPFPVHMAESKFVVLYLHSPYKDISKNPFTALSLSENPLDDYKKLVNILLYQPEWGIVKYQNNWLVLEQNAPDNSFVRNDIIEDIKSLVEKAGNP